MSDALRPVSTVDEDALIAEYDAEKPARHLSGRVASIVAVLGVTISLLALWWVFSPVPAQRYRPLFLGAVLMLTFLVYRGWGRRQSSRDEGAADNPALLDWALVVITVLPFAYIVLDAERFFRRSVSPGGLDVLVGSAVLLLTLEGARRTVGWVIPAIVGVFLLYAYLGPLIPAPFNTASFPWPAIIGREVMSTGGIFSEPLAVAASYLILFTLYGAVLEYTGAARFFLDVSFAAFGQSSAGPGRTVTLAGFLLGTVSGSGVATTVTLGGVSWPILRRAGYPKEEAGGVLAAAGIGAILSPPTLGAAAFLIAEILRVSYLEVLLWATVPTLLYYLGIVLAIEMDARRYRTQAVKVETPPLGRLLLRYGYHFSSLIAIVVFLSMGMTAFRAVVLATALAVALSFLDRQHWMTPRRAWEALAAGARGVLPVASVMAAAGLIVGVMGLTGLAAKLASIIVTLAAGNLAATALLSAVAVLLLGLAVPVTASFIIAYAVIRPALTQLGVPQEAAAMFVFYYAVLSEVSPPTALSPFAAAAITGGRPLKTMLLTWKYTLPAFLVPFIFVLAPAGSGLLLQGEPTTIILAVVAAAIGVSGLAVATGAWLLGPAGWPERILFGVGGIVMLVLSPVFVAIGLGVMAAGLAVHLVARHRDAKGAS